MTKYTSSPKICNNKEKDPNFSTYDLKNEDGEVVGFMSFYKGD